LLLLCSSLHAVTFADWVSSFGLSGGNATATADPDNDGVPNLIEFGLAGLSPISGNLSAYSAAHKVFLQTRNADGSYNAMTTDKPVGGVTTHLVLRITKRSDAEGITWQPETSSKTIEHWGYGDSAFTSWADGTYTYYRTISDANKWGGRGFVRLRVIQQ
jgi:hypothetical protein